LSEIREAEEKLKIGKYKDVEAMYKRSEDILQTLGPKNPLLKRLHSKILSLYLTQDKYLEAEKYSLKILQNVESNLESIQVLKSLISCFKGQKKWDEAIGFCGELTEKAKTANIQEEVVNSLVQISSIYLLRGDHQLARKCCTQALKSLEDYDKQPSELKAMALNTMGHILFDMKQYKAAEEFCQLALEILEKLEPVNEELKAELLSNLAEVKTEEGDFRKAEEYLEKVISIFERVIGTKNRKVANSLCQLAKVYHKKKNFLFAEGLYKSATNMMETLGMVPELKTTYENMAQLFEQIGRHSEAKIVRSKV